MHDYERFMHLKDYLEYAQIRFETRTRKGEKTSGFS